MKPKKNPRSSLEKKRLIFFETGIILSLSLVLLAFEWSSREKKILTDDMFFSKDFFLQEETVINTRPKEIVKPKAPEIALIINRVPNDIEVDEPEIWDPESRGDESFELWERFEPVEEIFANETYDFISVEEKPLFNGEDPIKSFGRYVVSRLVYPGEALANGVEGRVTVYFVIDEGGNVTDVKVIDSPHPVLSKEAIRVISSSPKWTPGKQRTKPVSVGFYFPVVFKIN